MLFVLEIKIGASISFDAGFFFQEGFLAPSIFSLGEKAFLDHKALLADSAPNLLFSEPLP